MRLRPHHVGIIVSDLDRSKDFYAALGFKTVTEHSDDEKTISFMELGDMRIELFTYRETPPAPSGVGRMLGFRHFALICEDLDDTVRELSESGILPPEATVREVPGVARLLFFEDPNGVEIEVMQEL